jgi:hypothetical protein
MKLPAIITGRDTASKIEAAQFKLTAAETRIAQLNTDRDAALIGDSVEEVIRLDGLIDQQRRAATIHRDRIAALQVAKANEDWLARERAREEAITRTVEPAAAECCRLAAELEQALATACSAFQRLEGARAGLLANWPAAAPRPRFGTLEFSFVQRDLFRTFQGWTGSNFVDQLKRELPQIAASVRESVGRYIADARKTEIPKPAPPEPEPDEAEAEAA